MASFFDLPEPCKCSVLKKYTHAETETVKCKAQQLATENEAVAILSECNPTDLAKARYTIAQKESLI
jgi:hypothetical protein